MSQQELQKGEFLIFEDKGCHMVGQSSASLQYTPSTLILTNFQIKLNPQFNVETPRKIALKNITTFEQKVVEDSTILQILSKDSTQSILLFIPDENHRTSFVKMFQKLLAANNLGQDKSNELAVKYSMQYRNSKDLNHFYENIKNAGDDESPIDQILKPSEFSYHQLLSSFNVLFTICNYISDIQDTSPMLFFAVLIIFLSIVSIIVHFFNFGIVFAFVPLSAIIAVGILQRLDRWKTDPKPDYTDSPNNIKQFMIKIDDFRHDFTNRLTWGDAQSTLQTCEFLIAVCFVFYFLDPLVVLAISLVGLSFFERWDPFKLGSLSKLLSKLILW